MICDKNKCYGCFSCFNICPKQAISMVEDKFGYIYPEIDAAKCINCNLCKKVCPSINESTFSYPQKCYASYSKDTNVNAISSSGGIAYELYKYIINNNGICYGVSNYLKNNAISFIQVEKIEDLKNIQGSKYVHAYVNDIFKKVEKYLKDDKLVLFIGTPCQVDGLKMFLRKDYQNLFLIDIICHGVPSQKFLKNEINTEFNQVSFRYKNKFRLIAKKMNNTVYSKNQYKSYYYNSFLKGITYRENCYTCKYAQNKRVSDVTIGDFWGLKDSTKQSPNGTSVILINTNKGENLINNINNIRIFEEKVENSFKENPQLNYPTNRTEKVEIFKYNYKENNFKQAVKKTYKFEDYYKIEIGNLKENIKKMIKK